MNNATANQTIGIISDTHGLLRNSAVDALDGVDRIIHAGDIDRIAIIEELEYIAPVHVVRGNMDYQPGVDSLPEFIMVQTGPAAIGVIHNRDRLSLYPESGNASIIISGHTHKAAINESGGILYINPGSAGPPRSGRPPSVAVLKLISGNLFPEIIFLPA